MAGIQNKLAAERDDLARNAEREPMDEVAAGARARLNAARAQQMDSLADGQGVQDDRGPGLRDGRERVPFGAQEQQLAYPDIPGYRLYWFNDTPGRIARAKKAGYEHVCTEGTDAPIQRNVGRGEGAQNGLTAYLMKIPRQWYEEDAKSSQDDLDRRLRDIREGRGQGENTYTGSRHNVRQR